MRVLNHPPILFFALIVMCNHSASAAALDTEVKNILLEEAAGTQMDKGVVVKDTNPDPSIIPNATTDFEALEASITSQIKQALGNEKESEESKQSLQGQLELDLEKVVSSALLQGNKLDDIRNAVAAAMIDIKASGAVESEIPVDKIQSAELALKEIVSEGTASTEDITGSDYVQSLKQELNTEIPAPEVAKAPLKSTMTAVDSILATMSKTTVELEAEQEPKSLDVNTVQVETSPTPVLVKEAPEKPAVKVDVVETVVKEPDLASKPKLVALETVTVGKGETLFKVAKRVYGTGKKYLALYEANKDTIANPDIIFVGQVLKVPR
jgi:nucleoid-associated protein YgaU